MSCWIAVRISSWVGGRDIGRPVRIRRRRRGRRGRRRYCGRRRRHRGGRGRGHRGGGAGTAAAGAGAAAGRGWPRRAVHRRAGQRSAGRWSDRPPPDPGGTEGAGQRGRDHQRDADRDDQRGPVPGQAARRLTRPSPAPRSSRVDPARGPAPAGPGGDGHRQHRGGLLAHRRPGERETAADHAEQRAEQEPTQVQADQRVDGRERTDDGVEEPLDRGQRGAGRTRATAPAAGRRGTLPVRCGTGSRSGPGWRWQQFDAGHEQQQPAARRAGCAASGANFCPAVGPRTVRQHLSLPCGQTTSPCGQSAGQKHSCAASPVRIRRFRPFRLKVPALVDVWRPARGR